MPALPRTSYASPIVALALMAASAPAHADDVDVTALPEITDSNYSIDLYQGSVLGSGRIVGMGGASVATAEGSAGATANPAAPAVRPATSNDKWDWDWHFDWLSPELGSDFDNNGIPTTEELSVAPLFTLGVVGQYKQWALGLNGDIWQRDVGEATLPSGETAPETASLAVGRIIVARSFLEDRITAGLGVRTGEFAMLQKVDNRNLTRFKISGAALEAGAIWRPTDRDLRVGVAAAGAISGSKVQVADCDAVSCDTLPGSVEVPWQVSVGVAYRRGPTRWNQKIKADWRDERSLLLAADLLVVGAVEDGYGIEAYVLDRLQRSGASTVFSIRAGAEYEWKPGWLRIRGGSYWEPGRFLDQNGDTIGGRLHVTIGLDVRVYSFRLWGDNYRAKISLTSDGAEGYGNGGLSVGLWH